MNQNVELANWIATVATAMSATVMIVLGVPLIQGSVKPNRIYGFRTSKTLANESIWYAANRVMGRHLLLAGWVVLIASIGLMVIDRQFAKLPVATIDAVVILSALAITVVGSYCTLAKMTPENR